MGAEFSPKMPVKSLTSQQIVRIHQLFRQAKFDDPSGDVSCRILFYIFKSELWALVLLISSWFLISEHKFVLIIFLHIFAVS